MSKTAWLLAAALLAAPAMGMWAPAPLVDVDRLARNVGDRAKENPKDPQAHYILGRVHSLAFSMRTKKLAAYSPRKGLPTLDSPGCMYPNRRHARDKNRAVPTVKELQKHLEQGLAEHRKAIALSPKNGLYHLGLAWLLEAGADMAAEVGAPPGGKDPAYKPKPGLQERVNHLIVQLGQADHAARKKAMSELAALASYPPVFARLKANSDHKDLEIKTRVRALMRTCWLARAIDSYTTAYHLSIAKDLKVRNRPLAGLKTLVGYDAGQRLTRLIGETGLADKNKSLLADIEKNLATLRNKPRGPVTPIIFSLDRPRPLSELVSDRRVTFDLDGDLRSETRRWVRPQTCILAWDPLGKGRIENGRQLFGSVTWWMFFDNGYHALDALDDNRDGTLRGAELKHIVVWRDRNGNGRSDPGEVVPLERLGISAIATKATGLSGKAPCNRKGLIMKDGRALPTYDWISE